MLRFLVAIDSIENVEALRTDYLDDEEVCDVVTYERLPDWDPRPCDDEQLAIHIETWNKMQAKTNGVEEFAR